MLVPASQFRPCGLVISPLSVEALGMQMNALAPTISSAVWPSANLACAYPVRIPEAIPVSDFFVFNGATIVGGESFDIALYDDAFARIANTGSTAQAGSAQTLQIVGVTDFVIDAGRYYCALSFNGVTATVNRAQSNARLFAGIGCWEQATAFPLPATATPAVYATPPTFFPLFGFAQPGALL